MMNRTINEFKKMFPLHFQACESYTIMDSHTIKMKMYNNEKLIFRYYNNKFWSLETLTSYKEN